MYPTLAFTSVRHVDSSRALSHTSYMEAGAVYYFRLQYLINAYKNAVCITISKTGTSIHTSFKEMAIRSSQGDSNLCEHCFSESHLL